MTYRVIQWASGGVGRAAMQGVRAHPDLELVGCWVHAAEKNGVDIGTLLVGRPRSASRPPATSRPSWPSTPTASSTARSSPTVGCRPHPGLG